jgi:hypothetical protein
MIGRCRGCCCPRRPVGVAVVVSPGRPVGIAVVVSPRRPVGVADVVSPRRPESVAVVVSPRRPVGVAVVVARTAPAGGYENLAACGPCCLTKLLRRRGLSRGVPCLSPNWIRGVPSGWIPVGLGVPWNRGVPWKWGAIGGAPGGRGGQIWPASPLPSPSPSPICAAAVRIANLPMALSAVAFISACLLRICS